MDKERDDSSVRQYDEDMEENGVEKLSKHSGRDKDRRRSSRVEEKEREHRSKDSKERSKDRVSSKVKDKDYEREKSRDKDRKDRGGKEKEREKGRDRDRDRDREREKDRERLKEKEREKYKERDNGRDREREWEKGRERNKEGEAEHDKDRLGERERIVKRRQEEDHLMDHEDGDSIGRDVSKHGKVSFQDENEQSAKGFSSGAHVSTSELEERILKMKEERSKKKSDAGSEVLSFVNRMRKIEAKKKSEKEKAMQLSKVFEEQDNILHGESDDEEGGQHNAYDLAGVKVLHGLDKVMEGGAVVLTLKDQSILDNGDINEEVDMLENVEIGEQKRRNEAYKAAKKKTGTYDDKFNDDPSTEKRMLPQYDDPVADEGVTLDAQGRFTGEAEKKLEELRRRLQGAPTSTRFEDLNSSGKILSDYYTSEEMLQFKKPKKKKALRKKLDIDAIEADAVAAGLGKGDLGSRNDGRRQAIRKEQERSEAEMRHNAYQSALEKADEASKALRLEQTLPVKWEEDENQVFADDDEDLYKSLERARKLALKKQEGEPMGPEAIALRATSTATNQVNDDQDPATGESQDKLVFTEMEEFVWALQHDEEVRKPDSEDVFMDEDEAPKASEEERKDEAGGWTKVDETTEEENPVDEDMEDVVPDETIHEVAVGKGLSGALKLLKERGTLKETVEWGGRNMDKKKSKLVGIMDDDAKNNDAKNNDAKNNDRFKDIRIERLDEFGRIMTPKEAFRNISHKFHGKGPGKMKQEKRMKQYYEELKLKQMKNSDTPSESAERMREAQAQLKTPYLVLSGHVKPGQTSDPRSGFATVEKDFPGSLTPMLGDRKVEQYLGIKRKPESGDPSTPKKPPKAPKL